MCSLLLRSINRRGKLDDCLHIGGFQVQWLLLFDFDQEQGIIPTGLLNHLNMYDLDNDIARIARSFFAKQFVAMTGYL